MEEEIPLTHADLRSRCTYFEETHTVYPPETLELNRELLQKI